MADSSIVAQPLDDRLPEPPQPEEEPAPPCYGAADHPPGQWDWHCASAASQAGDPCWWRLVWCHERCHKRESEARRAAIKAAAREAGAALVCIKKASKFATWLAEAQRPPFVLLTDWREVKPCTQAAEGQRPQNRPVFTVVLAEGSRQFERASAWARGIPLNDPVHVCQDIGLPKAFFSNLTQRLLISGAPYLRIGHELPSIAGRRPLPHHAGPQQLHCGGGDGPGGGEGPAAVQAAVPAGHERVLDPGCRPAETVAGPECPKLPLPPRGGGEKFLKVLSPVYLDRSPMQVAQLLREAMPDHYEE